MDDSALREMKGAQPLRMDSPEAKRQWVLEQAIKEQMACVRRQFISLYTHLDPDMEYYWDTELPPPTPLTKEDLHKAEVKILTSLDKFLQSVCLTYRQEQNDKKIQ